VPKVDGAEINVLDSMGNALTTENGADSIGLPLSDSPIFVATDSAQAYAVGNAIQMLSVRVDSLPRASRTETAGDYAVLYDTDDDIDRRKPDISLWYRSSHQGWREVFRYGVSHVEPTYRATADGIEIEWSFARKDDAFFLEPGQFPADVVDGARLWQSIPNENGKNWRSVEIELPTDNIQPSPTHEVPDTFSSLGGSTTLIDSRLGIRVILETQLEGRRDVFDEQPSEPGGWRLYARHGTEVVPHQYYRKGDAGPLIIRVLLRAEDRTR